ncbi:MAG TPA: hypothetical protein DD670_06330 [Planctomycetaceae bacterium]|nr:hypothetical protein [Planctomycetaceae bacterium]
MRFRERLDHTRNELADIPAGNPGGTPLEQTRQAGEHLYQAASGAIDHALSGDSTAFLQATRQAGGQ